MNGNIVNKVRVQTFSDALGVEPSELVKLGLLNQPLLMDDNYYVDVFKFKDTEVPEFKNSYENFLKYFGNFFKLLKKTQINPLCSMSYYQIQKLKIKELKDILKKSDAPFKGAFNMLDFREFDGFNLGYSKSLRGSSIGTSFKFLLLKSALDLIELDIDDPEVFCLLPFLQEGIGCDRISDIFISINYEHFVKYTSSMLTKLRVNSSKAQFGQEIINIYKPIQFKHPLILIPKKFVRPLPLSFGWDDIFYSYDENSALREKLNRILISQFATKGEIKKTDVCNLLRENPSLLKEIIQDYKETTSLSLFEREYLEEIEDELNQSFMDLPERKFLSLKDKVFYILEKFKWFVEKRGTWRLFYSKGQTGNKSPLSEDHIQRAFFLVAQILCEQMNISVTPEADTGIGVVDFKFTENKEVVLIEVKLSTHSDIVHGFLTQLPEYIAAENSQYAYFLYVVLNNVTPKLMAADFRRFDRLKDTVRKARAKDRSLFFVDARRKVSASKA